MTDTSKTTVTQTLDSSLNLQTWQIAQIEQSMAEMNAGQGIPHEDIEAELSAWRKDSKGNKIKRAK
jgi:predicted transcriptional regulator